jgi:hypothetical protein
MWSVREPGQPIPVMSHEVDAVLGCELVAEHLL